MSSAQCKRQHRRAAPGERERLHLYLFRRPFVRTRFSGGVRSDFSRIVASESSTANGPAFIFARAPDTGRPILWVPATGTGR